MPPANAQLRIALRPPRTHDGRRANAGRKPSGDAAGVSHHGRAELEGPLPIHATLRVRSHVWNLRSRRAHEVVEAALVSGRASWRGFRVVHHAGWIETEPIAATVTSAPETWLLREGWKRRGLLSLAGVLGVERDGGG